MSAKKRNKGLRRSIGSSQLKLRKLVFTVDGVVATPVASGFDKFGILQILDLGAGNYTIIFADPFERACIVEGHSMTTPNSALHVTAVAFDRVTVQCTDLAAGALDAVFSLSVMGSDGRFDQ